MSRVKKQHFVPKLYLLNFVSSGRKINVFDKIQKREFISSVDDVACEKAFYDVPAADKEIGIENYIEKTMNRIEDVGSITIKRILRSLNENTFCRFHPDLRMDLSLYLAVQYLRSKATRETFIELYEKLNKEEFYHYMCQQGIDDGVSRSDFDVHLEEDAKSSYHSIVLTDEESRVRIASSLYNMYWYILENRTSSPFYTSDQPLVKFNQFGGGRLGIHGFASPGIEIAFPLSPLYLLIMCDKRLFPYAKKFDNTISIINDYQNVVFYNHLQVKQSYRQIFSNKPGFKLARQMVKEEPSLSELNRDRIQVEYEFL